MPELFALVCFILVWNFTSFYKLFAGVSETIVLNMSTLVWSVVTTVEGRIPVASEVHFTFLTFFHHLCGYMFAYRRRLAYFFFWNSGDIHIFKFLALSLTKRKSL